MSYCVNCGVELAKGAKACPLCNTPVINPNELNELQGMNVFPHQKGQVERVKRKDVGILVSVFLGSIAVTCGLLNLFVFTQIAWSLTVIGACLLIWVLLIPLVIYRDVSAYACVAFDSLVISLYLYMIARMTQQYDWFWKLGLPIVILLWVLMEVGLACYNKVSKSFIAVMLYFFSGLAIFCVGLDLLIHYYRGVSIFVSWSSVVATVCIVFDVALGTAMSQKRVRNALRRRLHF